MRVEGKEQTSQFSFKEMSPIGGGCKAQAPDVEEPLTAWIEELRGSHLTVQEPSSRRRHQGCTVHTRAVVICMHIITHP